MNQRKLKSGNNSQEYREESNPKSESSSPSCERKSGSKCEEKKSSKYENENDNLYCKKNDPKCINNNLNYESNTNESNNNSKEHSIYTYSKINLKSFKLHMNNMEYIIKNMDPIIIGNALKVYRLRSNISQEELASKLNISKKAISNYEKGTERLSHDMLIKICNSIQIKIETLIIHALHNEFSNNIKILFEGV